MAKKPLISICCAILIPVWFIFSFLCPEAGAEVVIVPTDTVRARISRIDQDTIKLRQALTAYRANGNTVASGMTLDREILQPSQ